MLFGTVQSGVKQFLRSRFSLPLKKETKEIPKDQVISDAHVMESLERAAFDASSQYVVTLGYLRHKCKLCEEIFPSRSLSLSHVLEMHFGQVSLSLSHLSSCLLAPTMNGVITSISYASCLEWCPSDHSDLSLSLSQPSPKEREGDKEKEREKDKEKEKEREREREREREKRSSLPQGVMPMVHNAVRPPNRELMQAIPMHAVASIDTAAGKRERER
jgi:hypothetical protein